MVHIINFLLKILASLIFCPIGGMLVILAILFWDAKYMEVGETILEDMIWAKKKNQNETNKN